MATGLKTNILQHLLTGSYFYQLYIYIYIYVHCYFKMQLLLLLLLFKLINKEIYL